MAMTVDLVILYQNLNSGNRRINGLNSSLAFVGKLVPSSGEKKMKLALSNFINIQEELQQTVLIQLTS